MHMAGNLWPRITNANNDERLIDLERDLVGITISVYESNNVTLTNHDGDNVGV